MKVFKMIIKYSNQTTPITWVQIIKYHKNPPNKTLPRQESVIRKYQEHIDLLKNRNESITEYICNKLFSDNDNKYCFIPNKFPYWFVGVDHYLIWFNPKYNHLIPNELNQIDSEYIDRIVKTKYRNNQYVYYENFANNKSVPGIKHLHVYIKTD